MNKNKQIIHKQVASKRGVSLSLNVVIIGIILLIVLGVTLWIFYKGTSSQNKFLQSQYNELEKCSPGSTDCTLAGGIENSNKGLIPFVPILGMSLVHKKRRAVYYT